LQLGFTYQLLARNVIGARLLSASGRQLFAIDNFRNTGRPLLSVLADKDSAFFKGLGRFQNRVLYANVVNDRATCYYTAGISRFDPYVDMSGISLNYIPGYSPIVLDPDNPISTATEGGDEKLPVAHQISGTTHGTAMRWPMVLIYTIVIPIGMVIFLLNSLIQTMSSMIRIRLHSSDKLGYDRLPPLVEEMQEAAEELIEDIHHEMIPQHLTANSEESAGERLVNAITPRKTVRIQEGVRDSVLITLTNGTVPQEESVTSDSGPPPPKSAPAPKSIMKHLPPPTQEKLEFPTLALSHQQFEMINNIDELNFRKYPVFIHNDRHSHAAIIVRKPWAKRWDEGRVVVAHWLDKAFIV